MRHRSVLATLLLFPFLPLLSACLSTTQMSGHTPPSTIAPEVTTTENVSVQEQSIATVLLQIPEEPVEDAVREISTLRNAVRLTPGRTELRLKLADTLYRIGEFDAALDECRAAITLSPNDAKAHLQLGVLLMARQDWKSAASTLKEAVRLNPDLAQAHYNLGGAYYALGKVTAAVQSYREAIALQPDFPDARYRLALSLKMTNDEREAVTFMEEAAIGGMPHAQYFLGNAYKQGLGVGKSLSHAITWWAKAASLGYQPAADALSTLRHHAFAVDQPEQRRQEITDAFRRYRQQLWSEYPYLTRQGPDESLGMTLLHSNQATDGVTVLLAEAYALSAPAQAELARLYENGDELGLAHHDRRILVCFDKTAAEGFPPAKKTMARIYAKGLGVEADRTKARIALKGLAKQEVQTLIDELGLR